MIGGAITITALIAAIEDLIDAAAIDSPLYGAEAKESLRFPVDSATKVIRADVTEYVPTLSAEDCRKELNAKIVIECFMQPASDGLDDLIDATHTGSQMAFALFEGLEGSNLGGQCSALDFEAIEPGDANIQATVRAASYLYGTANQVS